MTRHRFSPGRWAIGAAAVFLAGGGVALFSQPTESLPPAGWVEVPCSPWPGGPGPCYAPPPGETFTIDAPNGPERCTTVDGGRHVCVYITPALTRSEPTR